MYIAVSAAVENVERAAKPTAPVRVYLPEAAITSRLQASLPV